MVILKLASFVLFFVTGARSGSQFLPLESGTEYISPHEFFGFRKESRKGNRQSITIRSLGYENLKTGLKVT